MKDDIKNGNLLNLKNYIEVAYVDRYKDYSTGKSVTH